MRFDIWTGKLPAQAVDCIVIGAFEGGELGETARTVDAATGGRLRRLLSRGDFPGRQGDTLLLPDLPGVKAERTLLVGLGAARSFNRRAWRRACTAALSVLARTRVRSVALGIDPPSSEPLGNYYFGRAVAEITGAALYRTNDQKTGRKPPPPALTSVSAGPVSASGAAAARRGLAHGAAVAEAQKTQRDLGNLPGNVCTPSYLAQQARQLARRYPSLKVQILDEAAIRRQKMGCLLAVAQGSEQPPRFIVLEHRGGRSTRDPIVLVGKGITFDTGGVSIKPVSGMKLMRKDMAGAAAVCAAALGAAELRLPVRVTALVALAENMPSGSAQRPGDVVRHWDGRTSEVRNTDAEGRLVLADALAYAAAELAPDTLVDLATLTGANAVALGARTAALYTEDDALAEALIGAATEAGERVWRMPLVEDYTEAVHSDIADLNNSPEIGAGSVTAALYLREFTGAARGRWVHLDMSAPSWIDRDEGELTRGATGWGVRTLLRWLAALPT